jgi:hypothetical protein
VKNAGLARHAQLRDGEFSKGILVGKPELGPSAFGAGTRGTQRGSAGAGRCNHFVHVGGSLPGNVRHTNNVINDLVDDSAALTVRHRF